MDILEIVRKAPVASFFFAITLVTSLYDMGTRYEVVRPRFILNPYITVHRREWHRMFTGALIHGNLFHLIFNMYAFFVFGFVLEMNPHISHVQFGIIYVGSLLLANVPDVLRYRNQPHYNTLGASGAISGMIMAFVLLEPTVKLSVLGLFPLPGWLFGIIFLVFSYFAGRYKGVDNVNHDAHLWGAVGGVLLTLMLDPGSAYRFLYMLNLV